MINEKKKNIKMNLTLNADFYQTLKKLSEHNHLKISTWTKQFLMRQIHDKLNNKELYRTEYPF